MAQAHPKYIDMVVKAINAENKAKGSSRRAITKYVMENFPVPNNVKLVSTQVNKAIVAGIEHEVLVHNTEAQDSGLFRVNTERRKKPEATEVSLFKKPTVTEKKSTITEKQPESLKPKEDRNFEDDQNLTFHIVLPFSQLVFFILIFLFVSFLTFYFVFPLNLVRSYQ
ncbi:Histone H1 [Aphelenchoides besseyi]|nr:Histone H1 [Aphelenchoides besseyi]KAI6225695.1 Histone H1 [Aphelenchoides besseyi]